MEKAKKTVASRWHSFDESVREMVQEFIAHLQTFDDATTCGLLTQTTCHKFIGTLYIIKEILTHLAVRGKTLQQGQLSFAGLPSAVLYCLTTLDDVLRRKDVILATPSEVFAENGKFGLVGIQITEASTTSFGGLITTYVAKLRKKHIINIPFPATCSSPSNLRSATPPCKGNP